MRIVLNAAAPQGLRSRDAGGNKNTVQNKPAQCETRIPPNKNAPADKYNKTHPLQRRVKCRIIFPADAVGTVV